MNQTMLLVGLRQMGAYELTLMDKAGEQGKQLSDFVINGQYQKALLDQVRQYVHHDIRPAPLELKPTYLPGALQKYKRELAIETRNVIASRALELQIQLQAALVQELSRLENFSIAADALWQCATPQGFAAADSSKTSIAEQLAQVAGQYKMWNQEYRDQLRVDDSQEMNRVGQLTTALGALRFAHAFQSMTVSAEKITDLKSLQSELFNTAHATIQHTLETHKAAIQHEVNLYIACEYQGIQHAIQAVLGRWQKQVIA